MILHCFEINSFKPRSVYTIKKSTTGEAAAPKNTQLRFAATQNRYQPQLKRDIEPVFLPIVKIHTPIVVKNNLCDWIKTISYPSFMWQQYNTILFGVFQGFILYVISYRNHVLSFSLR